MATKVKNRLSAAFSNDPDSDSDSNDRSKYYRLRLTAGPTYDKSLQRLLGPNAPHAQLVSDSVSLLVRIRDYTGFPSTSPPTNPYFDAHPKTTFSISFSFTPPRDMPASDLVFGIDTGHNPIRKFGVPQWLVDKALSLVTRVVDSSLTADAAADEPWLRGPAIAGATTTVCVGELGGDEDAARVLADGVHEGATTPAAADYRRQGMGLPGDAGERRKHLLDSDKLAQTRLQKGRRYYFDFANGYIDWKKYAIKLPLLSVSVLRFVGAGKPPDTPATPGKSPSHKVRFFLKDTRSGEVFFVIMATLVTGAELGSALREDEEATQIR